MTKDMIFEQTFDNERNLQYVNGEASVMHCHHYATIFTKLALDMSGLKGRQNLFDAMEETAYLTLQRYFIVESVKSIEEKIFIVERYYALSGLGQLHLSVKENGGRVSMKHSHVDEGWIKKWGRHKTPVNLIGQGYLAGALSAVFRKPIGFYHIQETQSIVSGASTSEFTISTR